MIAVPHISQGGRRQFGGPNGYGHRVVPMRRGFFGAPRPALYSVSRFRASVAQGVNFSSHIPNICDQGPTSSCEGHATSGALFTSAALGPNPLSFQPSPDDIYRGARCIDRTHESRAGTPLEDIGTDPESASLFVTRFGIRPAGDAVSGRDGFSDVSDNPAELNREPQISELIEDGQSLVHTIERVYATSQAEKVALFTYALSVESKIIRIAIDVDEAFESYSSGVVTAPDKSKLLGGHALYAVGYETDKSGKIVGIGVNSWGTSWGIAGAQWSGGFFRFDESFIGAMSVIDAVDVK